MRVLSIGNSFSQDAQYYLHDLSIQEGREIECINLLIGGCPLKLHWENTASDAKAYTMEVNGKTLPGAGQVSIREMLAAKDWDVITLQQASHDSGQFETYEPYLTDLADYIRKLVPGARLMIQETWAYEADSDHPEFQRYLKNQSVMYAALRNAYRRAAESIHAPLIPVGDVIQALRDLPEFDYAHGGVSLCRDGFHLSMSLGRYAAAATWYMALQKKAAVGKMVPELFSDEERKLIPLVVETAKHVLFADCM